MHILRHATQYRNIFYEVVNMQLSNDKSKKTKQPDKQKEIEQQKPNSIETVILEILQSKKSEQKLWLNFQDIVDGFQNKALLIDYWNKSDEFRIDLSQALSALEIKGKIEKKIFEQESYFSRVS
jgi:hypothetical protein